MLFETEIGITAVSNGWLVRIPTTNIIRGRAIAIDSEENLRWQARIMKDEMQSDDILKNAKRQAEEESTSVDVEQIKNKSLFIFKTFPEVLAFLKIKIDGE
jgi:hypothetical protein